MEKKTKKKMVLKKYRNIILFIFILIIISVFLFFSKNSGTIRKELKDFAVEDTSLVTKIFMVNKENKKVLLEREEYGNWKVNKKFFARKDAIDILLKTIKRIEAKYPVSKSAKATVLRLLSSEHTKVEIYQKENLIKTYFVGSMTANQNGTYMLLENSSMPFVTHIRGFNGYLSSRYFIDEGLWRSQKLFNYNFKDIDNVEFTNLKDKNKSFKISNLGDNKFSLKDSENKNVENFNILKLKKYLSFFKKINFEGIANKMNQEKKDSILNSKEIYKISVTNKNSEKKILRIFLRENIGKILDDEGKPYKYDLDRLFANLNNNNEILIIQYYVFDNLFMDLEYFKK